MEKYMVNGKTVQAKEIEVTSVLRIFTGVDVEEYYLFNDDYRIDVELGFSQMHPFVAILKYSWITADYSGEVLYNSSQIVLLSPSVSFMIKGLNNPYKIKVIVDEDNQEI